MMKFLWFSIATAGGLGLGILLLNSSPVVRAGGGQPTASQNGDVNGDGTIDVSDAVYTLLFLFKGGPPPVALAPDPTLISRLEECEARARFPECPIEGRFRDNEDGTVTDACTGLIWQKAHWDRDGDGIYRGNELEDEVTLEEAQAYCQGLELAGQDDWRLPTLSELLTLIRLESPVGFTGEPNIEPNLLFWGNGTYWSSTVNPRYPDQVFSVSLFTLTAEMWSADPGNAVLHVRAVRGP